jgi:hypothetical protein
MLYDKSYFHELLEYCWVAGPHTANEKKKWRAGEGRRDGSGEEVGALRAALRVALVAALLLEGDEALGAVAVAAPRGGASRVVGLSTAHARPLRPGMALILGILTKRTKMLPLKRPLRSSRTSRRLGFSLLRRTRSKEWS